MKNKHSRQRVALAVAGLLLTFAAPSGRAAVSVSGGYWVEPGGMPPLNGSHLNLPGARLFVGTGSNGSFAAGAGSQVDLGLLAVGVGGLTGVATLDGAGTVMRLHADGNTTRLDIGNSGIGNLTVSGGALLDGRADAAACLLGNRWCTTFVGNAAGSTGMLTVTGADSEARLLGGFITGNLNVNNGFGTAGATTHGSVLVDQGGLLRTEGANIGVSWQGPDNNGSERSVSSVAVMGGNSRWLVEAGSVTGSEAYATFASGAAASAGLVVLDGGHLEVLGAVGQNYSLRLGNGGNFTGTVSGAGSALLISGDASTGTFNLGEGGTASLLVGNGGKISGGRWAQLGFMGGSALLTLDAGTADFGNGFVTVGNQATGRLQVLNGSSFTALQMNIGSSAPGSQRGRGDVVVDGAGSVLALGGTADMHRLAIGDWGDGTLTVSGGGLLDTTGGAAACAGHWCGTIVGHMAGSHAQLTVTGAGSEARLLGELRIGAAQRFDQAHDGWDGGTPDGTTRARVEVLNGGKLSAEWANVGAWPTQPAAQSEQSFADVVVAGAGSTWLLQGSAAGGNDAFLGMGTHARSTTTLDVSAGGLVSLQAPVGRNAVFLLSTDQGSSVVTLRDSGSRIQLQGGDASVEVGAWNTTPGAQAALVVKDGAALTLDGSHWSYVTVGNRGSQGTMEIRSGGQVSGARVVNVGNDTGEGSLLITGAGSLLTTNRNGSAVGQLNVGQGGTGRLDVLGGGAASVFSLQVGSNGGRGQVVIDGVGSKVEMDAVDWHRMAINGGSVTVSGGALLDGTVNAAACNGHWCGVFIANNAGDDGVFTVTGAGSTARFLSNFNLGQAYVTAPPSTPWTLGEAGGSSFAQANVLAGGRLETGPVNIANGPLGPNATGSEGVIAQVRIRGAGSVWSVTGGNGSVASFASGLGQAANTLTDIQITNGGQLQLAADASTAAWVQLGTQGGINRMNITGAGSKLVYGTTSNAGLWIGRNGSMSSLSVGNGGAIERVNRVQVGNTGAVSSFSVAGSTTRVTYGSSFADLFIGRAGAGVVDISDGAQVQMHGNLWSRITVGDNNGAGTPAGQGSLTLRGAGTLLSMKGGVAGDTNTLNPTINVGWSANGALAVRDGAVLRLEGLAPASASQYFQGAGLTIADGWGATSNGQVEISGPGSKLLTLGTNPFITVGTGPNGSGHLSLSNGAFVQTTLMGIADFGATGSTQIDNATLKLEGAWRDGCCIGASLSVGSGTSSVANLALSNGAQLLIGNSSGAERTNLSLGGLTGFSPGGSGIMNLASGSRVSVTGSGGGGGQIVIGATSSGVGIVRVAGGSLMNANYLGVGALNGSDAGTGTLLVQDTSTVTADQIEIGVHGYVGGTGTLIGNVINRGIFSPGNSPGTLHIEGSFANQAGGKLVLEVESDGHGGFITDQLVFGSSNAVNLAGVQIEFRFLGATDPNAFQASGGFQIDSFLRQGSGGLDHSLLGSASYSASSSAYQFNSFSFSANGGAVFQAQAVPEPQAWVLWLAGLLGGGWVARRRSAAAKAQGGGN